VHPHGERRREKATLRAQHNSLVAGFWNREPLTLAPRKRKKETRRRCSSLTTTKPPASRLVARPCFDQRNKKKRGGVTSHRRKPQNPSAMFTATSSMIPASSAASSSEAPSACTPERGEKEESNWAARPPGRLIPSSDQGAAFLGFFRITSKKKKTGKRSTAVWRHRVGAAPPVLQYIFSRPDPDRRHLLTTQNNTTFLLEARAASLLTMEAHREREDRQY